MAAPLLILREVSLTFGGTPLLAEANLSVGEGERLCLVGRNGSGKSTLLKIAAGLIQPDRGERVMQQGVTVQYLPQEPDFSGFATTLAYVAAGLTPDEADHRARALLEGLGLTGDEDPRRLSGGEARRAALARVLAPDPEILLLDEPTNHLDLPAIEWLEETLKGLRAALVLISHDRRFLETLSRSTLWLDRGATRFLDRGFAAFEEWRDTTQEQEELQSHKLERKIAAEQDWLRYGVTARRKRNQGRLRALMTLRREKREERRAIGNVKIAAAEGEQSGKLVIDAKDIAKGFDGRPILRDLTLRIRRGDRLGIVGPNGSGKTTLINLLTGAMAPDAGTIRHGANLQMATLDQRRAALDPQMSLKAALTGGGGDTVTVGGATKHVLSYMKDFLFAPDQAPTPVGKLSGGERARLMLARALALPSNLLVLDEPTNDLDLETMDLLQEFLGDYPGTVLLVSHDRDFIDRVVTSVVLAEGNGRWTEYAGGYSDMIAQRGEAPAAQPAAKPKRAAEPSAPVPAPEGPRKRRLSFNQRRALEELPKQIDRLQAEIARHQDKLRDPDLFARDRAAFAAATTALETAQAALTAAEDEWLAVEMLREEIEG